MGQERTVQSLGAGYLAKLDFIPNLPQGLDQPALLPVAQCATKRGLLFMQPVLGTGVKSLFPRDLCVSSTGGKVHYLKPQSQRKRADSPFPGL